MPVMMAMVPPAFAPIGVVVLVESVDIAVPAMAVIMAITAISHGVCCE
jgi:hypothetical protein